MRVTVKKELVADGSYNDEKGVNTPKLGTGMTPIKWNGSSWVNTTGNDPDWYDYTAKKWANAKTSDGSMWVWIPRYAYSITSEDIIAVGRKIEDRIYERVNKRDK